MLFLPQSLTPTLVRPQTFDPTSRFHKLGKPQHGSTSLQSPDSDSPSVRFQQKLLSTCCLDILPVRASYESCSWGKPRRPHFRAFPHRTSYIQFFKVHRTYLARSFAEETSAGSLVCLVFAFQYKAIISCLKLLFCKASIKISYLNCKQESSYTLPCFPLVGIAESLQQEER